MTDAPPQTPSPPPTPPTPPSPVPLVRVRGEASLEAEPEIARFSITVSTVGRDRRRTLELLTERTRAIREHVLGLGDVIEELTTGTFAVYPRRDRRKVERDRAFDGSTRMHGVVTDFAALGELLPWLAEQDMVTVAGPWWQLRRTSTAYRTVRKEAVAAALERARDYAEALGADVTGLIELADTGMSSGTNRTDLRMRAPSRSSAPVGGSVEAPPVTIDLDPGTITVSAQLEATFALSAPTALHPR